MTALRNCRETASSKWKKIENQRYECDDCISIYSQKRKPSAHIDVDEWATNKKVKKQYSKDVTLVQSSLLRHFGSASGSTAMSNATFLLPERDVSVHAQEIEGEEDISQPLVDFAKIRYGMHDLLIITIF